MCSRSLHEGVRAALLTDVLLLVISSNHGVHNESKEIFVGQVDVRNPDGIHIRPAMAITRLCVALREFADITVLISATGEEGSFVDAATDFDLAQAGFGIAYMSLASSNLVEGSRPTIRLVSDKVTSKQLRAAFTLMQRLFADSRGTAVWRDRREF